MKLIICGSVDNAELQSAYRELEQQGHRPFTMFDYIENEEDNLQTNVRMLLHAKFDGIFLLPDWQHDKAALHLLAIACSFNKIVMPANGTIIPRQITFQTYKSEDHAF